MPIKALRYAPIALLLSACGGLQPPTYTITAPFDQAQARAMLVDGPNTVEGSAVMRTRGGEARTCAGSTVELVPATAYATERMRYLYGSTERGFNNRAMEFSPDHAGYDSATRKTVCDGQGNFRFTNVADGSFYVVAPVIWQVVDYATEGGVLMQRVDLSGGETVSFVMAP